MKLLVIIPTYNERENIVPMLDAVTAHSGVHVLVVDDSSPDDTAGAVRDYGNDSVHLLSRPGKQGLGRAYIAGFKWALERGYDLVMEMDADFSHDPADIPRFVKHAEVADLVIGSRYIEGVNVVNWPFRRLALSYLANIYAKVITGVPIKDLTGGFKCYRRDVLRAISLDAVRSNGYSFQIEMNSLAWYKKFRVIEIPIVFTERRAGVSKMSKSIIYEALWMVWRLRLRKLFGRV